MNQSICSRHQSPNMYICVSSDSHQANRRECCQDCIDESLHDHHDQKNIFLTKQQFLDELYDQQKTIKQISQTNFDEYDEFKKNSQEQNKIFDEMAAVIDESLITQENRYLKLKYLQYDDIFDSNIEFGLKYIKRDQQFEQFQFLRSINQKMKHVNDIRRQDLHQCKLGLEEVKLKRYINDLIYDHKVITGDGSLNINCFISNSNSYFIQVCEDVKDTCLKFWSIKRGAEAKKLMFKDKLISHCLFQEDQSLLLIGTDNGCVFQYSKKWCKINEYQLNDSRVIQIWITKNNFLVAQQNGEITLINRLSNQNCLIYSLPIESVNLDYNYINNYLSIPYCTDLKILSCERDGHIIEHKKIVNIDFQKLPIVSKFSQDGKQIVYSSFHEVFIFQIDLFRRKLIVKHKLATIFLQNIKNIIKISWIFEDTCIMIQDNSSIQIFCQQSLKRLVELEKRLSNMDMINMDYTSVFVGTDLKVIVENNYINDCLCFYQLRE